MVCQKGYYWPPLAKGSKSRLITLFAAVEQFGFSKFSNISPWVLVIAMNGSISWIKVQASLKSNDALTAD